MNKFSKKLHGDFLSGKINGAIFSYINKLGILNNQYMVEEIDEHIESMNKCNVSCLNECEEYFKIYASTANLANKFINNTNELYKYAFLNRDKYNWNNKSSNVKILLDFLNINKELIKTSYPNNMGVEGSGTQGSQYNINRWIDTMRDIYDYANTNNFTLEDVTRQTIDKWNNKEKEHFIQWLKYYQEGNYGKYNVKTAQFFTTRKEQPVDDIGDARNKINDIMRPIAPVIDQNAEKKRRVDEARRKLRGRLKSVEELIEQYRDIIPKDISVIMRKDVYDLKEKVLGLELKASLVDSIMRTYNKFNKFGFVEGASALKKIAQEVVNNTIPEIKEEIPPLPPQLETMINEGVPTPEAPVESIETTEDTSPDILKLDAGSIDIPDFSTASYREALLTLERVNQVIAEKNVVRALAAVDIILASLGVASHFPELSEAQIKLMDSFQYASTRISSVISQLRGSVSSQMVKKRKEKEREKEIEQQEIPKENMPATTIQESPPPLPIESKPNTLI